MGKDFHDELERAKKASVGQLLFKAARLFNELAVARVRTAGAPSLRPAHTALFPHIDLDGTRLTELARRLGVTKQAAGQVVAELEEMGMLERLPDPADGRARLVRFSAEGRRALLHGLGVLGAIEAQLARRLGRTTLERLGADLRALIAALEQAEPEPKPRPPAPSKRRGSAL